VPEPESEQREAQIDLTEVVEDPNQSSEEPKASNAQERQTLEHNPYFQYYAIL
jgi:hypothetical protein